MSGVRFIIGIVVMAIALPLTLFLLLGMSTLSQFFTLSISIFLAWGVADLFATILEKPRLSGRSPGKAFREDWERRSKE